MAIVTAISNQKGGVGKTTITVNLGKNLAAAGHRVLLVDNDPQGNLTMAIFGDDLPEEIVAIDGSSVSSPGISNCYRLYLEETEITPYPVNEFLHVIGSSKHLSEMSTKNFDVVFEFRDHINALRDSYDYVLFDCLPSFGLLQTAAHISADHLLIPTLLDDFSVSAIGEQLKTATNTKKRLNSHLNFLGVIVNEVSRHRILVEEHFAEKLREKYGEKVFDSSISKSAKIKESHAWRQSVSEYKANSDQAQEFKNLTEEFVSRIERAKDQNNG